MRKTKRFTPKLFKKYENLGRGTGTFEKYIPFHRVGRSDPSSRGRSHLELWRNRHRELLSDGELVAFLFSTMLPNVIDIREQFPLNYDSGIHELNDYNVSISKDYFRGTQEICNELGYRHPSVNGNGKGDSAPWPMTTDLLLTIKDQTNQFYLLAISCKDKNFKLQNRDRILQEIERQYWLDRGVNWLLITPNIYAQSTALTLRRNLVWGLAEPVTTDILDYVALAINHNIGTSFTNIINHLSLKLNNYELSQRAFWQSVWTGIVPMDLRRGWRPHLPIDLLTPNEFWLLNPIASGRTAWE